MNNEQHATRDDLLSPKMLGRFVDRLRSCKRQRVLLPAVWRSYHRVYGADAAGLDARTELKAILNHLKDNGVCVLPVESGCAWDRASVVILPKWVRIQDDTQGTNQRPWRRFPWHPGLVWVPQLVSLSQEQEAFLMKVQRALVEGLFVQRAPFKYRSLQLTGNEKRLAALLGTQLFGEGRLTLELLNCDGLGLPLTFEKVHPAPRMIVFENAGSFMVARRVLKTLVNPPYGTVAYGGGTQILRAVDYLSECGDPKAVDYVGDLDPKGIEIGAAFAARGNEQGWHWFDQQRKCIWRCLPRRRNSDFPMGGRLRAAAGEQPPSSGSRLNAFIRCAISSPEEGESRKRSSMTDTIVIYGHKGDRATPHQTAQATRRIHRKPGQRRSFRDQAGRHDVRGGHWLPLRARQPLDSGAEGIRWNIFEKNRDKAFINALALAVKKDLAVLDPDAPQNEELATIFEEYAAGGFQYLVQYVRRHARRRPGELLGPDPEISHRAGRDAGRPGGPGSWDVGTAGGPGDVG